MKKRYKILLSLLVFIIVIGLVALSIITFTKLPEKQFNDLLVIIGGKSGLEIKVKEMNRSWWNKLELKDISVNYRTDNGSVKLGSIREIDAYYNPGMFLSGKFIVDSLLIKTPVLKLKKDNGGNLLFPHSTEGKSGNGSLLPGLIFGAKLLKVEEGTVEVFDKGNSIEGIEIKGAFQRLPPEGVELSIDKLSLNYPSKDLLLSDLRMRMLVSHNKIEFDSLYIRTAKSDVYGQVNMFISPDPVYTFDLEGSNFSFAELSRLTGVKLKGDMGYHIIGRAIKGEIGGKADLDGLFLDRRFEKVNTHFNYRDKKLSFTKVRGKIFNSGVKGEGWLNFGVKPEKYYINASIKGLNLNNIIFNSLDTDFNGKVIIRGRGLSSRNLLMDFNVDLGKTRIETYNFDKAVGKFQATPKDIKFEEGFKGYYKHTEVEFNGDLEYSGELNLKGNAHFDDLNDFDGQIFLKDVGGRGEASFSANGPTTDFNLYAAFISDSCHIYGVYTPSLRTNLSLKQFVTHPEGKVNFEWEDGDLYSIPINSVEGYAVVAGDYTFIDSLRVKFNGGSIKAKGKFDGTFSPAHLIIDSLKAEIFGNKITNDGEVLLLIGEDDMEFKRAKLKTYNGEVQLAGTIDYNNNMVLELRTDGVDITPYASLIDKSNRWDGKLSCHLKIKGNFVSPEVSGNIRIKDLGYKFFTLGDLNAGIDYKAQLLKIPYLELTDPEDSISAQGFIPLNLAFENTDEQLSDSTFSFEIEARGKQLNILSAFIPEVEYLFGDYSGKLTIDNSINDPKFNGRLTLKDGILKIQDIVEPIRNLSADMKLEKKRISFENFVGEMEIRDNRRKNIFQKIWSAVFPKTAQSGEIKLTGGIDIRSLKNFEYNLKISGKNIPITHEIYDVSLLADANIEVKGETPPTVSGGINLIQLIYREPFRSSESSTADIRKQHNIEENMWNLDLNIRADNNVWVINPDMDAEFEGELNLSRQNGLYRIQGELSTIRGRYYLPPLMDFTINEGKITFNDPEYVSLAYINPELDVKASTKIFQTNEKSEVQGEKEIFLQVSGKLSEPVLNLTSSEGDSQQEILEYLVFHRSISPGNTPSGTQGTSFGNRAQGLFGDLISSQIKSQAAQSFGVETFEIKPSESGKLNLGETRIIIGKYISPSIYLRYSRTLSLTKGQEITAEYRLNRNFYLEAKSNTSNLYRLDLNFNIEF